MTTDAERLVEAANALWEIGIGLQVCVSLHRSDELDLARLIRLRDLARAARKDADGEQT